MDLSLDGALRILATGGGLRIKAANFLEKDLPVMAANAAAGGSQLIIIVSSFTTADTMVRIAESGKGHVIFDMTESSATAGSG